MATTAERALIVYLVVYYLLIAGAVVTLWRSGLITHLHRGWTYASIAVGIAFGALLWASFRRSSGNRDHEDKS